MDCRASEANVGHRELDPVVVFPNRPDGTGGVRDMLVDSGLNDLAAACGWAAQ